jgi:UDP-glucose 4-epimerase
LPIDERHPTEPLCSYGISKLIIEKHLVMQSELHGLRPVVLRVANPYGERQRVDTAQGAVAAFLSRCLAGRPIEIWGDGTVTRDYLHVADVANAFRLALAYDGPNRVFNVSSGEGTSLNQLIDLIGDALGVIPNVRFLPGRAFDVPVSVLDNRLAREHLGWTPRVGLRDGLERTIRWLRGVS